MLSSEQVEGKERLCCGLVATAQVSDASGRCNLGLSRHALSVGECRNSLTDSASRDKSDEYRDKALVPQ